MTARSKQGMASVNGDKQPGTATFKTSLRSWQAQYKAQKAAQGSAPQALDKPLLKEEGQQ